MLLKKYNEKVLQIKKENANLDELKLCIYISGVSIRLCDAWCHNFQLRETVQKKNGYRKVTIHKGIEKICSS